MRGRWTEDTADRVTIKLAEEARCRVEMLNQYSNAIGEALTSFRKACQDDPQDKQLVQAFEAFRQGLEHQLRRLQAIHNRSHDETERLALDQTIQTVTEAAQSAGSSAMAMAM